MSLLCYRLAIGGAAAAAMCATVLSAADPKPDETWPGFRGRGMSGVAAAAHVPDQWSATDHVKWVVPIAGHAWSSPIVWGNRVFVSQAVKAENRRTVMCFDRTNGKLLLAKQFIKKVTWASGIGDDGRPVKLPNQEPSPTGTRVCPSQDGATNWFSTAFNSSTVP